MDDEEKQKPVYLGDGLYARFDGYQIYLMANSHINPTDTVALDSHTLSAFIRYIDSLNVEDKDE